MIVSLDDRAFYRDDAKNTDLPLGLLGNDVGLYIYFQKGVFNSIQNVGLQTPRSVHPD